MVYEMDYRVDSRDVDLFNQCRPSAVLGILQEAATQAAVALGLSGPQVYQRYGCLWMVTRNWVELDAPLRWNDQVHIKTWHRGAAGASSYRDFDLFRDGKPIGQGTSAWVLVDVNTHRLVRMKNLEEMEGTDGGALCKEVKLHRIHMPQQFDHSTTRAMGYSDTDINGHINNIHYADFACDALHLERHGVGKFVRTLQIGYLSECKAGEVLKLDTAVQGDELFARGTGQDGAERFDCQITLADVSEYGK
ncbi:MAG TPA: acyl-ACP thioesterase [Clostridiales bacterium]|nr:acyl-ACP thioesterase [Clostridiales bacterium]